MAWGLLLLLALPAKLWMNVAGLNHSNIPRIRTPVTAERTGVRSFTPIRHSAVHAHSPKPTGYCLSFLPSLQLRVAEDLTGRPTNTLWRSLLSTSEWNIAHMMSGFKPDGVRVRLYFSTTLPPRLGTRARMPRCHKQPKGGERRPQLGHTARRGSARSSGTQTLPGTSLNSDAC